MLVPASQAPSWRLGWLLGWMGGLPFAAGCCSSWDSIRYFYTLLRGQSGLSPVQWSPGTGLASFRSSLEPWLTWAWLAFGRANHDTFDSSSRAHRFELMRR